MVCGTKITSATEKEIKCMEVKDNNKAFLLTWNRTKPVNKRC